MTTATLNDAADKAEDTPEIATPWVDRVIAFGTVFIAAAVLLHPTFFLMWNTWATSSTYIHGFFVAPLAFWMIIAKSPLRLSSGFSFLGLLIMIAAAGLWLAGRAASVSLVEQIAFIMLLIGAVGVVFGGRALRDWSFPLLFLFFMVPVGESVVPFLQKVTADNVVGLLSITGAQVTLDGYLIRTPAGAFEVAEACSGLRFLLAALMVAAVFAYGHFQSWRKRFLFLAFAAVLAIGANALRAYFIIIVASATDMRLAIGPDHIFIGWLTYALVFLVLVSVGAKHADKPRLFEPQKEPLPISDHPFALATPALAVIILAAAYSFGVIDRPVNRTAPSSLTLLSAEGWRILPSPENWRASLPEADRTLAATYAQEEKAVYISMGYFTHDRHEAEIVTYGNRAWDGDYWRKIGNVSEVLYLFGESKDANFAILAGPERRRLAAVTAYWLDGQVYFNRRRLKLAQMKAKLRGENPQGGVIIIASSYRQHPDEAVKTIRAFTVAAEPLQDWLARNGAQ